MSTSLPLDRVLAEDDPDPRQERTVTSARDAAAEAPPKKSKKMLIIVVVLLAAVGGGYYFFLGSSKSAATEKAKPGEVATVEAMTLNLADGHYLKLGLGIQLNEGVGVDTFDVSQASDIAIASFADASMKDYSSDKARQAKKKEYIDKLNKAYDDEVYDVFFTTFVMQ